MVLVFAVGVGGGGGEEVLCGAEGTEALAAGGSVLLGAHSFLLLVAAGKREARGKQWRGVAWLGFLARFLLASLPRPSRGRNHDTTRFLGLLGPM